MKVEGCLVDSVCVSGSVKDETAPQATLHP